DALANRGMLDVVRQGGSAPMRQSTEDRAGSAADVQARCVHDLVRSLCWQCRPRRTELPDRVAITPGGAVCHLLTHCAALREGWRQVSRRGGSPGDLTWVPIADALAAGRGGCEVCCAHLDLR